MQPNFAPMDTTQEKIVVEKAVFMETGTHQDMTTRPYQTQTNSHSLRALAEDTNNGADLSPTLLSTFASNFLQPSAQAQGNVNIQGGWRERRLRFVFILAYYNFQNEIKNRKVVQGYTNYVGVSPYEQKLDPNMLLYINSIHTLRVSQTLDTFGQMQNVQRVSGSEHLLRGNHQPNYFGNGPSQMTYMMRPQDLFSSLNSSMMADGSEQFHDARNTFATGPVIKSQRRNNQPADYLYRSLRAYRDTMNSGSELIDEADMYNNARGVVQEQNINNDQFFMNLTSNTSFQEGGTVMYQEVCGLFPEIDQVAHVVLQRGVQQMQQDTPWQSGDAGNAEHWRGSNTETIWASILTHSVPSIMMDHMAAQFAFSITNQTMNGMVESQFGDVGSFVQNVDMTQNIQTILSRLEHEVFNGLSQNNNIDFAVRMSCDIVGDTTIDITVAGGPTYRFQTPSFCDALFVPVITEDQTNVQNVAYDIQGVAGSFQGNPGQNHQMVGGQPMNFGGNNNGSAL